MHRKKLLSFIIIVFSIGAIWILKNKKIEPIYPENISFKANLIENVIYKKVNNQNLTLDIYKPLNATSAKNPVIIFIHGGGWTEGSKSVIKSFYRQYILYELLNNNISVVSVNYSLLTDSIHIQQPIIDCKDAIRWIYANASKYNIDNKQIGIWGSSAGGHIALMSAYTPFDSFIGDKALENISPSLKFVISDFGPTDLNKLLRTDINEIQSELYNLYSKEKSNFRKEKIHKLTGYNIKNNKQKVVNVCRQYSPINHLNKNTVPTLLQHGLKDEIVNVNQSEILNNKLSELYINHKFITYKGLTHGFKNAKSDHIQEITDNTLEFITNNLK